MKERLRRLALRGPVPGLIKLRRRIAGVERGQDENVALNRELERQVAELERQLAEVVRRRGSAS